MYMLKGEADGKITSCKSVAEVSEMPVTLHISKENSFQFSSDRMSKIKRVYAGLHIQ